MNTDYKSSPDDLSQAVDGIWETLPPFWHRLRAHIRQVASEKYDISVEQFHLLRHIHRGQGSVSLLAKVKNISRPAISQTVDVLVNKGYITRITDPSDRRHVPLALTESGRGLLDEIFSDTRQWMIHLLAPLSREELQGLNKAMESLRKLQSV